MGGQGVMLGRQLLSYGVQGWVYKHFFPILRLRWHDMQGEAVVLCCVILGRFLTSLGLRILTYKFGVACSFNTMAFLIVHHVPGTMLGAGHPATYRVYEGCAFGEQARF